jgi:hypothetical protein
MSQVAELIINTIQNFHNELEQCEEGKIKVNKGFQELKNAKSALKKALTAMAEAYNCTDDKECKEFLKLQYRSIHTNYNKTKDLIDSKNTELNNLNDRIEVLYSEKRIAEESLALIRIAEEKRAEELLAEARIAEEKRIEELLAEARITEENGNGEQLESANATTSYSRRKPRVERDRISDWAKIPTGTVFLNKYKGERLIYVKKGDLLCCEQNQKQYESLSHAMRDYLKERGQPNPTQNAWIFFKILSDEKPVSIDQFLETI